MMMDDPNSGGDDAGDGGDDGEEDSTLENLQTALDWAVETMADAEPEGSAIKDWATYTSEDVTYEENVGAVGNADDPGQAAVDALSQLVPQVVTSAAVAKGLDIALDAAKEGLEQTVADGAAEGAVPALSEGDAGFIGDAIVTGIEAMGTAEAAELALAALTGPVGVVALAAAAAAAGIAAAKAGKAAHHAAKKGKLPSWLNHLLDPLPQRVDPLVLDLTGQGIQLTSLQTSNTYFDLYGNGVPVRTGWVEPTNGLLVDDANHNSQIDGIQELFGSATESGFDALRALDSNGDGVIDAKDAAYQDLAVWVDANGDGIVQQGELKTLQDLGIASINVAPANGYSTAGDTLNGNEIAAAGSYTTVSGQTRSVAEVDFNVQPFDSAPALPTGVSLDPSVYGLPNLPGHGDLMDLWSAMTLDPDLKSMMQQLVSNLEAGASIDSLVGSFTTRHNYAGIAGVDYVVENGSHGYVPSEFDNILMKWASEGDPNAPSTFDPAYIYTRLSGVPSQNIGAVGYADFDLELDQIIQQVSAGFLARIFAQLGNVQATEFAYQVEQVEESLSAQGGNPSADDVLAQINANQATTTLSGYATLSQSLGYNAADDLITGDVEGMFVQALTVAGITASSVPADIAAWLTSNNLMVAALDPDNVFVWDAIRSITHNENGDIQSVVQENVAANAYQAEASDEVTSQPGQGFWTVSPPPVAPALHSVASDGSQMTGAAGVDVYTHRTGDGNIAINDASGNNELAFEGDETFKNATFGFGSTTQDLRVTFADGETVDIDGFFGQDGTNQFGLVDFADGTSLSGQDALDAAEAGLATSGADTIVGASSGGTVAGGGGNDILSSAPLPDGDYPASTTEGAYGVTVFNGGTGNDLIRPASGTAAIYEYNSGDGDDAIVSTDRAFNPPVYGNAQLTSEGGDIISLGEGFSPEDIQVSAAGAGANTINGRYAQSPGFDGSAMVISFSDQAGSIAINDAGAALDSIQFATGQELSYADLAKLYVESQNAAISTMVYGTRLDDDIVGGAGDQTLLGGDGDDTIVAGAGNDTIDAGAGANTYIINAGSGHDTILANDSETGSDILQFGAGIAPSDIRVAQSANGQDLILTVSSTSQTIILKGEYQSSAEEGLNNIASGIVGEIQFADGTRWNTTELWQASEETGTLLGATAIYTGFGADSLTAGSGNVTLFGREYGDQFTSGAGNDVFSATGDGNTYTITASNISTTIETTAHPFGFDSEGNLIMPDGITAADVTVSQASNEQDLILTLSTGQVITLKRQLGGYEASDSGYIYSTQPIGQVQFSDGTIWSSQDLLQQSIDTMEARGNDTVFAGEDSIPIDLVAGAGTVTLDASRAGNASSIKLTAGSGTDTLIGGIGDATYRVNGDATNVFVEKEEWIQGSSNGSGKDNTLAFGEGISSSDITVAADPYGSSIVLTNTITGATVQLLNQITGDAFNTVEQVVFADGTVWSAEDLLNMANAGNASGSLFGSAGDDVLTAPDGAATLHGEAGNDVLMAGNGADLLIGGQGSDTYKVEAGDGPVVINDSADASWYYSYTDQNVLQLGPGIAPSDLTLTEASDGRDIILTVIATGQTITLKNQLDFVLGDAINSITFADGTIWNQPEIVGGAIAGSIAQGATTVYGDDSPESVTFGSGDITFHAGAGDTTVVAGYGNQTFDFRGGVNTIEIPYSDFTYTILDTVGINTIQLGVGITQNDVLVTQSPDGSGVQLSILSNGQTIDLQEQLRDQDIREIKFADGSEWSSVDIAARSIASAEDAGVPDIYGDVGNNTIIGGSTDETLYGEEGSDTLVAGSGNDTLVGSDPYYGFDSDTYIVSATAGNTTVVENALLASWYGFNYTDTLQFGPGIDPADIAVSQGSDGQSIVLTNTALDKSVTIENILANPRLQITFSDGTIWTPANLWERSAAGALSSGAPTILGDASDNILSAGSYDVTLVGNGGDDTFVSGTGDATFVGDAGNETYDVNAQAGSVVIDNGVYQGFSSTVVLGGGIKPEDFTVTQAENGRDLILTDAVADISITLIDQIASGDESSSGEGGPEVMELEEESNGTPLSQTTAVQFSDGTVWTTDELLNRSITQAAVDGNTTIYGDRNSNTLVAGSGNETLVGQGGDDTFINGTGNDTFIGSGGTETYQINVKNGGTDTIVNSPGDYSYNIVQFGAGIASSDISVSQAANGQDLILTDTVSGQELVLQGQIDPDGNAVPSQTSEVDFSNGTSWQASDLLNMSVQTAVAAGNTTIYGDRNDNVLQGGDGDETLIGQGGSDTLIAGAGNDTLIGGGGYTTYEVGASTSSYVIEAQLIDGGGSGPGPVGVEVAAAMTQQSSPWEYGPDGELDLSGIDSSTVQLSLAANGSDLILTDPSSGETITIDNEMAGSTIDEIVFDDGTSWGISDIENILNPSGGGTVPPYPSTLPPGNYTGTDGDDSFNLSTGFTVDGGLGDDHYTVSGDGSGAFYFAKGEGHDELDQPDYGTRDDALVLTDTNSDDLDVARTGESMSDGATFTIASTGDSFQADWQFYGDESGGVPQGIEQIQFADGVTWDRNEIENRITDSVLEVGAADALATPASEIFDLTGLSGNQSIDGFDATSSAHDYLQVNRNVFADWAHLLGATQQVGNDLVITIDSADSLTLKNIALADFTAKDVQFAGAPGIG